jgi:hypothetical protein
MAMQRWVLERGGVVRDYLLTASEPSDAQKRAAVFGANDDDVNSDERDLAAEGAWRLASTDQLVGTGWTFDGGTYAPPAAPAPPRTISAVDFLARFTPAEVVAMQAADPRLHVGSMKVLAQNSVNLDSAECAALLGLAVAKGALTPARALEVRV